LPLLGGWLLFAFCYTTFMLSFIPLYPELAVRLDVGGALGTPSFAENPAGFGVLATWPFNLYQARGARAESAAFGLRAAVGDYLLLIWSGEDDRRVALRVSGDARISSAILRYEGQRAVEVAPLPGRQVSAKQQHLISAWRQGDAIHFYLDGRELGARPDASGPGRWQAAGGLTSARIAAVGFGPSPDRLDFRSPWLWKRLLQVPLIALIALLFPLLFAQAPGGERALGGVIIALFAALLWQASIWLLAALPAFFAGALLVGGISALAALSRRPRRRWWNSVPARRTVGCLLLLVFTVAPFAYLYARCYAKTRLHPEPDNTHRRIASRQASAGAAPVERKVAIFGSSTAAGVGLEDRATRPFFALLARQFPAAAIELRAGPGVVMNDVLAWERATPLARGDLAVLCLTFNEAMARSERRLAPALLHDNGLQMLASFHHSSDWMKRNWGVGGEAYRRSTTAFASDAAARGAAVVLVGEPCAEPTIYADRRHGAFGYYDVLRDVARREGALYLDAPAAFIERRDDVLFVDAVHLTERGHQLLAALLAPVIADWLAHPAALVEAAENGVK
jgi:lysophospholipase L1-like esterase